VNTQQGGAANLEVLGVGVESFELGHIEINPLQGHMTTLWVTALTHGVSTKLLSPGSLMLPTALAAGTHLALISLAIVSLHERSAIIDGKEARRRISGCLADKTGAVVVHSTAHAHQGNCGPITSATKYGTL
jgi:hypothetical protein